MKTAASDVAPESAGKMPKSMRVRRGHRGMPNMITLIVLVSYVALLAAFVLITGLGGQARPDSDWFDLTKTGFTTLGSALTLILGYYFGQKQVALEAEREKEEAITEITADEEAKRNSLLELLKSKSTESQSDDRARATFQRGRPQKDAP